MDICSVFSEDVPLSQGVGFLYKEVFLVTLLWLLLTTWPVSSNLCLLSEISSMALIEVQAASVENDRTKASVVIRRQLNSCRRRINNSRSIVLEEMLPNCRDDELRHRKFSHAAMFPGYVLVFGISPILFISRLILDIHVNVLFRYTTRHPFI